MSSNNVQIWNLKVIISIMIERIPTINELFLFGSRAYHTNSLRSDIDILAMVDDQTPIAEINAWLPHEYPPIDLFISFDDVYASSLANGSVIVRRKEKYGSLPEQLDAIKLWSKADGFSDDVQWEQRAKKDAPFTMSYFPGEREHDETANIELALKRIEESGIHTFFAGSSIRELSESILQIIKRGLTKPHFFQKKARSFSFDHIKLKNEYDFQNYIHMILRPIFPDIQPEPFMVTIDGNEKIADFGLHLDQIIIEAKWIDSTSKKAEVLKTIDGLHGFYRDNPQIQSLLFAILYDGKKVELDEAALEARYEKVYSDVPVFVRFFQNEFV